MDGGRGQRRCIHDTPAAALAGRRWPGSALADGSLLLQLLEAVAFELLEGRGLGERALTGRQLQIDGRAHLDSLRQRAGTEDHGIRALLLTHGGERARMLAATYRFIFMGLPSVSH